MKTRITVSVIALPIIVLLIFFAPLGIFGCFIGLISCLASVEFLNCTEKNTKKRIIAYAAVSSAAIPVMTACGLSSLVTSAIFLLFLVLFGELLFSFRNEKPMDTETVANSLLAGAVMPVLLSSVIRLGAGEDYSVYVLIPFVIAFSCDSGAYFAGTALGKHKLAPKLSPKKTIEGSIGGFFCSVLLMLVYGLILSWAGFEVNFTVMAIFGFLGGLICQFGDLCFSAVKRIYGAKDYGSLIPGHGGALDRFDSMYFVAPLIEFLVLRTPPVLF